MAIADSLSGVTDRKERGRIKAAALAAYNGKSRTWLRGQYRITVSGISADGDVLSFHLRLQRATTVLFNDTVNLHNPPYKVVTGGTSDQPVYEERPLQALVECVEDVLRSQGVAAWR
jgi:hypothetical protein